ncbi:hypothetical protein M422DRAFT_53365 [Sphaerobolus stellatus SS14]|uniref:Inosine/uridine-preferring nucleoside hydrolase domain-containing protein n=1 Tax=Sphaerobolus stellatus (strain SS14) TaxID=990650 RepID=A0A0C9TN78_SPHS4|nr:hypothetical protein M422DRAFT_53365 [Sphaerobolus stellatus SS14]
MKLLPSLLALCLSVATQLVYAAPVDEGQSLGLPRSFKDVIIDTDFLSFTDDVGALAVANTLQNLGRVRILGIVSDVQSRFAVPGIDAIDTWYCNPDIPFAQSQPVTNQIDEVNNTAPEYITTLANPALFPEDIHDGSNKTVQDPLTFYRTVLQRAKGKSITIIGIGFLTHLNQLYQSPGGKELIRDKVAELIIQGGDFGPNFFGPGPNRAGYNLLIDLQAAKVLEEWPSPVTFLPSDVGRNVTSGQVLENTPKNNPIRVANEIYHKGTQIGDGSWDILATYYSILGIDEGSFRYGNTGGQIRIFDNGTAAWDFNAYVPYERRQHFLNLRQSNETVAQKLNNLLAFYGERKPACR